MYIAYPSGHATYTNRYGKLMKTVFHIILIVFIIASNFKCSNNKEPLEKTFNGWSEDSIKTFLTDHWILCGRYSNQKIVTDTFEIVYYDDTTETVIVNPKGKFSIINEQIIKRKSIPSINLSFNSNKADLHSEDCYLPNFKTCDLTTNCFSIYELVIRKDKFHIKTLKETIPVNVKYLNQDIIVIKDKAYIRSNKWVLNENLP